jgi:hypothetical protein
MYVWLRPSVPSSSVWFKSKFSKNISDFAHPPRRQVPDGPSSGVDAAMNHDATKHLISGTWDQWFMMVYGHPSQYWYKYLRYMVYDPIGYKHGIYNNIGYPSQYYMGKVTWVYDPIGYKML